MEEQESTLIEDKLKAQNQLKSGAGWFFWIAVLSIVNSVIVFSGSDWTFMIGLGITQLADGAAVGMAEQVRDAAQIIAFAFAIIVAGVFVLFGVYAKKRRTWAFVVGMTLYALDGLIFLAAQDWFRMGFLVFALFCIYGGYKAGTKLQKIESSQLSSHIGGLLAAIIISLLAGSAVGFFTGVISTKAGKEFVKGFFEQEQQAEVKNPQELVRDKFKLLYP